MREILLIENVSPSLATRLNENYRVCCLYLDADNQAMDSYDTRSKRR